MAKKIIHYDPSEAGQLHCDACGYDMPHKSEFTPALIGTPCPRCGADMLTRADYEATAKMFRFIDNLNRWFGWMGKEYADAKRDGWETTSVKIHNDEIIIRKGE